MFLKNEILIQIKFKAEDMEYCYKLVLQHYESG